MNRKLKDEMERFKGEMLATKFYLKHRKESFDPMQAFMVRNEFERLVKDEGKPCNLKTLELAWRNCKRRTGWKPTWWRT